MPKRRRGLGWLTDNATTWAKQVGILNADGTPAGGLPADVTKGGLIGADGSDWAVIPVGTDTHVLTANSALDGGWGWAAAAGGGRVTSWKTVGGDASDDYTNVSNAIDDGEYSLIVTSSISEGAGTTLPNVDINVIFESPSFTWTFSNSIGFDNGFYTKTFNVFLNGATITWGPSSQNFPPFNMNNASGTVNVYGGGDLTNTATANNNAFAHANLSQGYFGHYVVTLANTQTGGIRSSTRLTAESLHLIGGGSSCAYGFNNGSTDVYTQRIGSLRLSGSFSTSLSPLALSTSTTVDHLTANLTSTTTPITLGGVIKRYLGDASNTNPITISAGADVDFRLDTVPTGTAFTFPTDLSDVRFQSALLSVTPERVEYKTTSVTTATTTELFIDGSALQYDLASNDGLVFDIRVTGQRDNQEQVIFTAIGLMAINNGGTTSLEGAITSGAPDKTTQTGTAITLNVSADDTNDSVKITVGHPAENWDFKAILYNIKKINN